jgi:hypothetical protein
MSLKNRDCGVEQLDLEISGQHVDDASNINKKSCTHGKPKPKTNTPAPTSTPVNTPTNTKVPPSGTPAPTSTPENTATALPTATRHVVHRDIPSPTPTPILGCTEEMKVILLDQIRQSGGEMQEADVLRVYLNDRGRVIQVLNLTAKPALDPYGENGISLNGSVEPNIGCAMAFQHQMAGETGWNVWVTGTTDTPGAWNLTRLVNNGCGVEPEWGVDGKIYYSNICEGNRIYRAGMFQEKHHEQLPISGLHAEFVCYDSTYLGFTDSDGMVEIYNTESGDLINTGQPGHLQGSADCHQIEIVDGDQITVYDFEDGKISPYPENGNLFVPDPRREPLYDLLGVDGQAYARMLDSGEMRKLDNPVHWLWQSSWAHEPEDFWVYYTLRFPPDPSYVAGSNREKLFSQVSNVGVARVLTAQKSVSGETSGEVFGVEPAQDYSSAPVSDEKLQEEAIAASAPKDVLTSEANQNVWLIDGLSTISKTASVWYWRANDSWFYAYDRGVEIFWKANDLWFVLNDWVAAQAGKAAGFILLASLFVIVILVGALAWKISKIFAIWQRIK